MGIGSPHKVYLGSANYLKCNLKSEQDQVCSPVHPDYLDEDDIGEQDTSNCP